MAMPFLRNCHKQINVKKYYKFKKGGFNLNLNAIELLYIIKYTFFFLTHLSFLSDILFLIAINDNNCNEDECNFVLYNFSPFILLIERDT